MAAFVLLGRRPAPEARPLWWIGLTAFLFMLWTLAPLPPSLVGARRAERFARVDHALATLHELLPEPLLAGERTAPPSARRLTMNLGGTLRFLVLAAGMWAMFWGAGSLEWRTRFRLLKVLLFGGTLVAALALLGRFVFPQELHLWWWYPVADTGAVQTWGPFVSRNNFATFCAMLAPIGFCLFLAARPAPGGWRRADGASHLGHGPVGRAVSLLCLCILASAVFLSQSRGGAAALLVGLAAGALFWLRAHPRVATPAALIGCAAFVAVVLWPDAGFQERLAEFHDLRRVSPGRLYTWRDTWPLWFDHALVGCGLNGYRTVFQIYNRTAKTTTASHAESEYLQVLGETGLAGLLLAALAVIGLWYALGRPRPRFGFRTRHWRHGADEAAPELWHAAPPDPVLAAVAGSALVMLVHAAVDFPLRVPLNGFLFATLLGLAIRPADPPRPDAADAGATLARRSPATALPAVALLALLAALLRTGGSGAFEGDLLRFDDPVAMNGASLTHLTRTLPTTPAYWLPWYEIGLRVIRHTARPHTDDAPDSARDPATLARLGAFGADCVRQAAEYNPMNWNLWWEAGNLMWPAGRLEEGRDAYRRALELNPQDIGLWRERCLAEWQARQYEAARKLVETADGRLRHKGHRVSLWQWLATAERAGGSVGRSSTALERALAVDPAQAGLWMQLGRCHGDLGYPQRQRDAYREATERAPQNWQHWWALAEAELRLENDATAQHALSRAVMLNPSMRHRADALWRAHRKPPPKPNLETNEP